MDLEDDVKKFVLVFLAFLVLGAAGLFFGRGYIINEWQFSEDKEKGEISITGYNGRKRELVIPSEINGKPVTDIDSLVFAYKSTQNKVESVKIPDSVLYIYKSFYDMPKLKSVDLGTGIMRIGSNSFQNCESLCEISIPDSVIRIGSNVTDDTKCPFSGCSSLENVIFNEDKTEFTGGCFEGTPWLENQRNGEAYAVIHDRVTGGGNAEGSVVIDKGFEIAEMAFMNNDKITEVTIGGNIDTIGFAAFIGCDSLKNVVIEDGVVTIEKSSFYACPSLEQITIPDSVQIIEDGAIKCVQFLEDGEIKKGNLKILCSSQSAALRYAEEHEIDYELLE